MPTPGVVAELIRRPRGEAGDEEIKETV